MKRIISVVIILMAFIVPTFDFQVSANKQEPPITDIGPTVPGGPFSKCGENIPFCWTITIDINPGSVNGDRRGMHAIRTTMVDKNGKRLRNTKSVDYIKYDNVKSKNFVKFLKEKAVNFYTYPNYKKAIVSNNGDFRGTLNTSGKYFDSNNHTIVLLDENSFNDVINTDSADDLIKYFTTTITNPNNGMFENFFVPTFFGKMNYDLNAALINDEYKKHAILIEPIVYFKLTSNYDGWVLEYVGTPTEIVNMLSSTTYDSRDCKTAKDKATPLYNMFLKGKTYCGKWRLNSNPFKVSLPLSVYAEESGWGLSKVPSNSVNNNADNSHLILDKTPSNRDPYAFAAGHVWLGDIVKDSCPTNKKDITEGHLPECCDLLSEGDLYYESYCKTPVSKCDWKIDVSCPNNCFNKTFGSVKDMSNWACIYKSDTSNNANVKNHFIEWENKYCKMFCREEISYRLPQNNFLVSAGHHFTIGDESNMNSWSPIVFAGRTECSAANANGKIDHIQFKKDYESINNELPGLWNKYLSNQTQENLNKFKSREKARNDLLMDLNKCNGNWIKDLSKFSPSVTLKYDEDKYGTKTFNLIKNIPTSSPTYLMYTDYYSGEKITRDSKTNTSYITSYECKGSSTCVNKQQSYPTNDRIIQVYEKEINYHLPANTYQYVIKSTGESISIKPGSEYKDIGYSNLPIHYSRASGNYNISLEYRSFGNNNKFNRYVFNGQSFGNNVTTKCNTDYSCNYNVDNEIMPPELNDLNVLFRPISLSDPFPGKDGKGREPGSNWRGKISVITNNRGLSDPEKIYTDKEPMYEITLTPSLIKEIRRYNRSQSNNYTDFTLSCVEGTGHECRSKFIRDTFRAHFSGCGVSDNWDACS